MILHKGAHVAYRLHAHVIFVTKYRERRFSSRHLATLEVLKQYIQQQDRPH